MSYPIQKQKESPGMLGHAFSPSIQESEAGNLCKFDDIVIYVVSSRTVGVIPWRDLVSKQNKAMAVVVHI